MAQASGTRAVALASVGTGTVAFGIVAYARGKPPAVVVSERLVLPFAERPQEQWIAAIRQSLTNVTQKAMSTYAKMPKTRPITAVHAIIRPPWAQSRTVSVETAYSGETHISTEIIEGLARRALAEAHAPTANFLEATVIRTALNGYPTSQPAGKSAHKVELSALVCVADPALRAMVQEVMKAALPTLPVAMHAAAWSMLEIVRAQNAADVDCVILDVEEEGTASLVVRDGVLQSEGYVPEGIRTMLTRALPDRPVEETLANIRMIARQECDPATCNTVEDGLAKMEPDLVRAFGEFFASMGTPRRLPNMLIVFAHDDLLPWLSRFFSRIDFAQFTATAQPFEVAPQKAHTEASSAPAVGQAAAAAELAITLTLLEMYPEATHGALKPVAA